MNKKYFLLAVSMLFSQAYPATSADAPLLSKHFLARVGLEASVAPIAEGLAADPEMVTLGLQSVEKEIFMPAGVWRAFCEKYPTALTDEAVDEEGPVYIVSDSMLVALLAQWALDRAYLCKEILNEHQGHGRIGRSVLEKVAVLESSVDDDSVAYAKFFVAVGELMGGNGFISPDTGNALPTEIDRDAAGAAEHPLIRIEAEAKAGLFEAIIFLARVHALLAAKGITIELYEVFVAQCEELKKTVSAMDADIQRGLELTVENIQAYAETYIGNYAE